VLDCAITRTLRRVIGFSTSQLSATNKPPAQCNIIEYQVLKLNVVAKSNFPTGHDL